MTHFTNSSDIRNTITDRRCQIRTYVRKKSMNLKEINKMKVHPKRRSENIVVQDLNDEVLVYDLDPK